MDDNVTALIQTCLTNDNASWGILLQSCATIASNLHRYQFASLTNEDTENIVSNIYTKLFDGGLRNFSGSTKYELLSYFRTIAKNETISYIRANLKRDRDTSLDQESSNDECNELLSESFLEDDTLRPDTIAEINDLYKKAMSQLSIRDKQILLFKIEGRSDAEIATLLGISTGTVASAYNRIKVILKYLLLTALAIILFGRNIPWKTSL